ncbi:MAG: hypothetical protein LLG14_25130 [Nocardiaceae bacterium]|nr:hypothetical protein [Nocardiaceae bacterium]
MAISARSALHRRLLPHNPGKLVALAFAAWIALGTVALMLPISTAEDRSTGLVTALFTATGASCGAIAVVDTQTHWSTFGQVVIMILVQIGGLGIMTLASLLTLLVSRKIGLRMQLVAASEAQALQLGDTKKVITGVIAISLLVEAVVAVLLFARFLLGYQYPLMKALFYSVFHAITSYNNAGYALFSDNLMGFQHDAWVLIPVMIGCVLGSLGFPVIFELSRALRRARASGPACAEHGPCTPRSRSGRTACSPSAAFCSSPHSNGQTRARWDRCISALNCSTAPSPPSRPAPPVSTRSTTPTWTRHRC